jgi:hypothetical protein
VAIPVKLNKQDKPPLYFIPGVLSCPFSNIKREEIYSKNYIYEEPSRLGFKLHDSFILFDLTRLRFPQIVITIRVDEIV